MDRYYFNSYVLDIQMDRGMDRNKQINRQICIRYIEIVIDRQI